MDVADLALEIRGHRRVKRSRGQARRQHLMSAPDLFRAGVTRETQDLEIVAVCNQRRARQHHGPIDGLVALFAGGRAAVDRRPASTPIRGARARFLGDGRRLQSVEHVEGPGERVKAPRRQAAGGRDDGQAPQAIEQQDRAALSRLEAHFFQHLGQARPRTKAVQLVDAAQRGDGARVAIHPADALDDQGRRVKRQQHLLDGRTRVGS